MNKIVFFSSGAASWLAAKRVALRHGTDNLYLVFADTSIEDEDNYRFLIDAAKNVGGELIWLKDGRTPWDIFFEMKFLSHRASHCSIKLKVEPCRKWIESCEFDPSDTVLYFGIGFEEIERMSAIARNWQPFRCEAPLCWDDFGWADRKTIFSTLVENNLIPPRLYSMGFSHANCGGFCPKAGQAHYKVLLEQMPDRYKSHEEKEQEFRDYLGKDISILRRAKNGEVKGISLKEFREEIESSPLQLDMFDLMGCGCFIEEGEI